MILDGVFIKDVPDATHGGKLPSDPVERAVFHAQHVIDTYDHGRNDTFLTPHALTRDCAAIVEAIGDLEPIHLWQCKECDEYTDEPVNDLCPYTDCRGELDMIQAYKKRVTTPKRRKRR